ncbi:MAG: hypothetical protein ACC645_04955 [Pirellulales bacterium]
MRKTSDPSTGAMSHKPSDSFLIGAAGVPVSLLGPLDAPRFESVFEELRENGFNVFFPTFITREAEGEVRSSAHEAYFWPTESGKRSRCADEHSPYKAARGKLKIVVPAYVFLSAEQWSGELDQKELRARLTRFKDECLRGDPSVIAGFQNFDEPANAVLTKALFPDETEPLNLANVHTMKRVLKSVFRDVPVLVVEAPVPLLLEFDPGATPYERKAHRVFWTAVRETVDAGDWYGFDVYPVPMTSRLSVVGEHVRRAREHAPGKKILSVLQGFGPMDLGQGPGRRPTARETRFMAYDSVINGAEGIFWWGQSALDPAADDGLWDAIKATAKEIRSISGLLQFRSIFLASGSLRIEVLAKQDEKAVYVFAANKSTKDEVLSFAIPASPNGKASYAITDFFTGVRRSSGKLTPTSHFSSNFEAFGVGVYVISYD